MQLELMLVIGSSLMHQKLTHLLDSLSPWLQRRPTCHCSLSESVCVCVCVKERETYLLTYSVASITSSVVNVLRGRWPYGNRLFTHTLYQISRCNFLHPNANLIYILPAFSTVLQLSSSPFCSYLHTLSHKHFPLAQVTLHSDFLPTGYVFNLLEWLNQEYVKCCHAIVTKVSITHK